VVAPVADDLRPAVLTILLAAAYVVIFLTPVGRTLFDLVPLRVNAIALVAGGTVVWFFLVRTVWKYQLLQRFVST